MRSILIVVVVSALVFVAGQSSNSSRPIISFFLPSTIQTGVGWGFQHFLSKYSLTEEFNVLTYVDVVTESDLSTQRYRVSKHRPKIVFACGPLYEANVKILSSEFSSVRFFCLNCGSPNASERWISIYADQTEPRYLTGLIAGTLSKSAVGFVSALSSIGFVRRETYAFAWGVHKANPKIPFYIFWNDNFAKRKEIIEREVSTLVKDHKCDVIGQFQDDLFVQQSAEKYGAKSIGYHSDMSTFIGITFLTSNIWDWTGIYRYVVGRELTGMSLNPIYNMGPKNGTVSVVRPFSILVTPEAEALYSAEENRLLSKPDNETLFCGPMFNGTCLRDEVANNLQPPNVIDLGTYVYEYEERYVRWSDGLAIALMILLCLSWAVTTVLGLGILSYSNHGVMRASSVHFMMMILGGGILGLISVVFWIGRPTKSLCMARAWFLGFGFILQFGALTLKTWRVYKIFDAAKNFSAANVPNKLLYAFIFVLLLLDLVILLVLQEKSPLDLTILEDEQKWGFGVRVLICSSPDIVPLAAAFFAYKGLILVSGVVLAFLVRNVKEQYNESKMVGICIYNIMVVSSIIVPIVSQFYDNVNAPFILVFIGCQMVFFGTTLVMTLPKFYQIKYPPENSRTISMSSSVKATAGSSHSLK